MKGWWGVLDRAVVFAACLRKIDARFCCFDYGSGGACESCREALWKAGVL